MTYPEPHNWQQRAEHAEALARDLQNQVDDLALELRRRINAHAAIITAYDILIGNRPDVARTRILGGLPLDLAVRLGEAGQPIGEIQHPDQDQP